MKCISGPFQAFVVASVAIVGLCVPAIAAEGQYPQSIADRLGEGVAIDARTGEIRLSGRSHKGYYRAYACPSFGAARAVIGSVPRPDERRGTVARQVSVMRAALHRQHCSPARGTFRATTLGPDVWINHGYEAEENWVAVAASNVRGGTLGLIIDVSPYGPVQ